MKLSTLLFSCLLCLSCGSETLNASQTPHKEDVISTRPEKVSDHANPYGRTKDSSIHNPLYSYSTNGHKKAKGLDIIVQIPKNWEQREGNRPHIVQKFSSFSNDRATLLTFEIIVGDAPGVTKQAIKELNVDDFWSVGSRKSWIPDNTKFIRGGMTRLDGEKAFWYEGYMSSERAHMHISAKVLNYLIFYDEKLIILSFSVTTRPGNEKQLAASFEANRQAFYRIINSFILNSKWKSY